MSSLFDDFGFVAVVLQGLGFIAQSVLVGATTFLVLAIPRAVQGAGIARVVREGLFVVRFAAVATMLLAIGAALLTAGMLTATTDLAWRDVAGAPFVLAALVKLAASVVIAASLARDADLTRAKRLTALAAACLLIAATVADSHAIARLDDRVPLMIATVLHTLGAGLWLGGLPCLWLALRDAELPTARSIGRRYSALAAAGVAMIVAAAAAFAMLYLGSADAVYGTAYGAMAGVKTLLLASLLALGFVNFRTLHGTAPDRIAVPRVRRLVELEMAASFAVLMAAASITSSAVPVDVVTDRVSLRELGARMAPAIPSFTSPAYATLSTVVAPATVNAVRTAGDRAWSEYNHHVAGVVVMVMGIAALLRQRRVLGWTAHWPLLILLLGAFLLLRADPEVWPLGPVGLIASLRDPEVLQHRLFVVLIAAFAFVEWRVQRDRAPVELSRVFPLLMVLGGALLLTHAHAVANVKEQLLIEMTHLPIAVLGIVAGSARWLQLSAAGREGRLAGYAWPIALILVGLILLDYREA